MAEILVIILMALIAVYVFFDRMGRPRGIGSYRGANLRGADLQSAYLNCADLQSAYLNCADLRGTELETVFTFINGSKHDLQYNTLTGELRIGCRIYSLEFWLNEYDRIGQQEGYTDEEIKEYYNYMITLKGV